MSELLRFTMFQDVLFPPDDRGQSEEGGMELKLNRLRRFRPLESVELRDASLVIFDFETTGLDPREDRIIELGALKFQNGKQIDQFSSLIDPGVPLTETITRICGITNGMLVGQPSAAKIIPEFLEFIDGSILAAHNAEFDMAFLNANCQQLGYSLDWPCFCTLKLARVLLPQLESRNLDALAAHYELSFEARHRSIGDVKVTHGVLTKMLEQQGSHLKTWKDIQQISGIKD